MIWESHFWKDDLLKKAEKLKRLKSRTDWSERQLGRLEQDLMLGFYSIRKLHEAGKLSTSTSKKAVPLSSFLPTGQSVTRMNWHRIDELYDLAHRQLVNHDLIFVCHQVVHSYVFVTSFEDDGCLEGVYFASDRQRRKSLLHIPIGEITVLFSYVGMDYPNSSQSVFNTTTGDYDVISEMLPDEGS